MPRLMALNKYWTEHPPVHILVAAFLKYKSPRKPADSEVEDLSVLMNMFPNGAPSSALVNPRG